MNNTSSTIWKIVADIITAAYGEGKCRATYGARWRVNIRANDHDRWELAAVDELNAFIARKVGGFFEQQGLTITAEDSARLTPGYGGPCYFGHTSSSHRAHGIEV